MEMAMAPRPDQTSDMPYVRGQNRNIEAAPVFPVGIVKWTNKSRLSGPADTPFTLFEACDDSDYSISNRWLAHVGTEGSIWVNMLGGEAEPNAPGSFEVLPGDTPVPISTRGQVRVRGTIANIPITAAEG